MYLFTYLLCSWLIFLVNCSLQVLFQVQYSARWLKKKQKEKKKKKINATYLNMLDCVWFGIWMLDAVLKCVG